MTPKEKAEELFLKMYNTEDPLNKYPMCFDTAKQCALIAVDEVISYCHAEHIEYWEKVKNELEKL